nr:hypothetical protein Q903MT_gene6296 [Picea sitchensis]
MGASHRRDPSTHNSKHASQFHYRKRNLPTWKTNLSLWACLRGRQLNETGLRAIHCISDTSPSLMEWVSH